MGPLISWSIPVTGAARRPALHKASASNDAALARFDGTVLNALRETETVTDSLCARTRPQCGADGGARPERAGGAARPARCTAMAAPTFLTTLDAQRSLASAESALTSSDAQARCCSPA
jgi:multidrug efflux system outer membrane protein